MIKSAPIEDATPEPISFTQQQMHFILYTIRQYKPAGWVPTSTEDRKLCMQCGNNLTPRDIASYTGNCVSCFPYFMKRYAEAIKLRNAAYAQKFKEMNKGIIQRDPADTNEVHEGLCWYLTHNT